MNPIQSLIEAIQGKLAQYGGSSTYSWRRNPPQQTQSTPAPSASPQANLGTQMTKSDSGFKFKMGLKDYSFVRPQLEKLFNAKKNPPVQKYLDEFIKAGEQYGIDPRVLVSISGVESSFGNRYPEQSYNPFGYLVMPQGLPQARNGAEKEQQIWQGLQGAGFTSMPHAIDRLTGRFQRQPTAGYQAFYQDPSLENLQKAYNANPAEAENYIKNLTEFSSYYQ